MLVLARCAEESVPVWPDVKSEHSAEIDMLESHGRNVLDHVRADSVGLFSLALLVHAVHVMRVPSHRDIGEQCEGTGGGGQFFRSPATLGYGAPMMNSSL